MKPNRLLAGFLTATALFAVGCGKTGTPVSAPEPTARPDTSTLITQVEAEDYTEGYSGDNWNQTGYYAETNDGPIDITISYDDGKTILYRAIFTNGDWATYTIDVEKSGAHLFVVNGIGAGEFYLDDIENPIPFECEDDEKGFVANIMLDAGQHTVKVLAPTYLDMDSLSLYAGDSNHYMTAKDVAAYVAPAPAEIDEDAVQLEIYVSPDGKDTNSGKKKSPFATLTRAKEEVRKHNDNMTGNIIVHFAPGYYQLDETEVFSEEDSGTNGYSIIYKGDSETENSLISGGTKIEGWEATELLEGKIWKASTDIEDTRNLYVDGYPAQRARGSYQYMYTENLEAAEAKHQDNYNLAIQPADVKSSGIKVPVQDIFLELEHPEDVELVWPNQWVHQRTPVLDIYADPEDEKLVVFEMDMPYWEWANTKEADFTNPVYWDSYPDVVNYEMTFYLENDLALLDEPGEFYFDKTTKTMYYYPYEEEDLKAAEVYAGTTEFMIQVMGSGATARVENITFDNLEFCYGAWTEPNTTGIQITQTDHIVNHRRTSVANGGMTMPGQITLNFTRNVNIYNCDFRCLGSSALVMDNGVADSEVVGNVFMDISGTGIMIDSYEHRGILPEGRVRCDNILVANNVIHRPADQYYGMTGISMYMPSNTIVRNNDIEDTPYSGMVAGWGWGSAAAVASANNKILNNKIDNVMQVLSDGGHIYTLDRVHNLELAGNYLVKSGDYRGGIYLDSGSRSFNIHNNVVEDSERWFFGRDEAKIEDIELYDNYYEALSKSDMDPDNVVAKNNTKVQKGTDGTTQWPQEALDIIANAGLEAEYKKLLEGTELPEWRADVIDTMPTEQILFEVGGSDVEGAISIQAEKHVEHANTEEYAKNNGVAIKYNGGENCYSVWIAEVENAGVYTLQSLGTGTVYYEKGFSTVIGNLYINGQLVNSVNLNTNERYNPWENPLETVFGDVKLAAGTHVIGFEVIGGVYVMDRIDALPADDTAEALDVGEGSALVEGYVIGGAAGPEDALTIEAETYLEMQNCEDYVKDGYEGAAVKYSATEGVTTPVYTTWTMDVAGAGAYTVKTIGTGMILTTEGYTALEGKLYINDELMCTSTLTSNERFNPWDNPLETVLGTIDLKAGTYTVRFEVKGGNYIMDKMFFEPAKADASGSKEEVVDLVSRAGIGSAEFAGGTATGTATGTGTVTISAEISSTTATTIEAESYCAADDTEAYEKPDGLAVKYLGGPSSTTYIVDVEAAGTYSFTAVGTGMQTTAGVPILGNMYVDDVAVFSVGLTTNEKFNPWENPLESLLGSVELTEGIHRIKFENVRGQYIMDKMIVVPDAAN